MRGFHRFILRSFFIIAGKLNLEINNYDVLFAIQNNSRLHVFCEINALNKFAKFTGKHLRRGLFLIKLLTCVLQFYLERDSDLDVFQRIFQKF